MFQRYWPVKKALRAPSSVTTDGFGNVFVLYPQPANQAPAAIVKYTGNGKILTSWTVPLRALASPARPPDLLEPLT